MSFALRSQRTRPRAREFVQFDKFGSEYEQHG